jgi:class 3 adenylate cyclase
MKLSEIIDEAKVVFKSRWTERDGQIVPETDDLQLGNDAVNLDGTVLYADMADSTGLVNSYIASFSAEIYKTYLLGACRIIRQNKGEVTAFDGDRVMAVFIGGYKNTSAAKSALQINAFTKELNLEIKRSYPTSPYVLRQTVGIDSSKLLVARTGIRNANDLVWVGRAANYAAKLCAFGNENYPSYITEDVYQKMNNEVKISETSAAIWEKRHWTDKGINVYRSGWWWTF